MDGRQIIEEIIFIIKENSVLLSAILFTAFMVIWGSRRGLMAKLLSLCSVAATIAIEAKVYPIVLEYIKGSEALNRFFSELGMKLISGSLTAAMGTDISANTAGTSDIGINGGNIFAESQLYKMLGLDTLADSAAAAIGDTAAKIVCFIIIFIIIRLAVKVLFLLASGLKHIHFIDWADRFFGGIFGFFEGIVYLWLFMFVISGFPTYGFCSYVLKQISHDAILMMLYRQNLVMQFFAGMLM